MEIAILIGNILLRFGPEVARAMVIVFQKKEPTQADWEKVFELAKEPWKDYHPPTNNPTQ